MLLGAFNRHRGCRFTNRLPVTLLTIEREHGTAIKLDARRLIDRQAAFKHRINVARNHADTMRIMATKIGPNQ